MRAARGPLFAFDAYWGVWGLAASNVETSGGPRVMQVAHALFSAGFLVAAIGVGLARGAGAGPLPVLIGVSALVLASVAVNRGYPASPRRRAPVRLRRRPPGYYEAEARERDRRRHGREQQASGRRQAPCSEEAPVAHAQLEPLTEQSSSHIAAANNPGPSPLTAVGPPLIGAVSGASDLRVGIGLLAGIALFLAASAAAAHRTLPDEQGRHA